MSSDLPVIILLPSATIAPWLLLAFDGVRGGPDASADGDAREQT
jgi:hypothetical protein